MGIRPRTDLNKVSFLSGKHKGRFKCFNWGGKKPTSQFEMNFIPILRPIQNAFVHSWYFRNEHNQRHLVWFYGLKRFWKGIRYDLDKNNGGPDTEAAQGEYTSCLLSFKPLIIFLERKQGDRLGVAEPCARGQVQTVEPASTSPPHAEAAPSPRT